MVDPIFLLTGFIKVALFCSCVTLAGILWLFFVFRDRTAHPMDSAEIMQKKAVSATDKALYWLLDTITGTPHENISKRKAKKMMTERRIKHG